MKKNLRLCMKTVRIVALVAMWYGCNKHDTLLNEDTLLQYYETNRTECLKRFIPCVQDIVLRKGSDELFKIVHISDAHISAWSSNNPDKNPYNLIEAVRFANDREINFHALVETGDHIGNNRQTTRTEALKYLDAFAGALYSPHNIIPTFTSTGNHDANMMNPDYTGFALSKSDIYDHLTMLTNYPVHAPEGENYYYADISNPAGGTIRIIALDVIDQDNIQYDAQHYALFTKQQVKWFCETALKENMTANHSVIVLIHYPMPSNSPNVKKFISNDFQYSWIFIPEIVEAFRDKRSFSRKYKINPLVKLKGVDDFNESDSLSVDVSFKNTPGEFVCYLGGHAHTFLHYEVEGFNSLNPGIPKQIMILANNMSPSEKNPKTSIEREMNGLRNNTFNLYAIDTSTKMIYITFFGATGFYYPEIITLKYW